VDRIAQSLAGTARPVRRLRSPGIIAAGLIAICVAVGVLAAAKLGIYGLPKLSALEMAAIFPVLCALIALFARGLSGRMTPGSRPYVGPGWMVAGASMALALTFAVLFHDYHTVRFVPSGLVCLKAGIAVGIPAALLGLLIIRRGFFIHPVGAGMVLGALGGLAGVMMLEVHCPNFQALHVMVWHTAVVPVSSGLGGIVAWAWTRVRRSK
jgi:hypothetical protein